MVNCNESQFVTPGGACPEVGPSPATRKRYAIGHCIDSIGREPRLIGLPWFTTSPVGSLRLAATPHVKACDLNEQAGSFFVGRIPPSRQVLTQPEVWLDPTEQGRLSLPGHPRRPSLTPEGANNCSVFYVACPTVAQVCHDLRTFSVRNCLQRGADIRVPALPSRSCTNA